MCLLNGEVSGSLEASIDFGTEQQSDGSIIKIPLEKIILNAVHVYGREPYHNIIINDLDTYGLELLEYRGNTPMYLLRTGEDTGDEFINLTYHGDTECFYEIYDENGIRKEIKEKKLLSNIEENGGEYNIINGLLLDIDLDPTLVSFGENKNQEYKIVRI